MWFSSPVTFSACRHLSIFTQHTLSFSTFQGLYLRYYQQISKHIIIFCFIFTEHEFHSHFLSIQIWKLKEKVENIGNEKSLQVNKCIQLACFMLRQQVDSNLAVDVSLCISHSLTLSLSLIKVLLVEIRYVFILKFRL